MNRTYIQKGSDVKKDILSVYGIMNKHIPDIQLELKEFFKRDWAERQGEQEYIPSTAMFKAYEQDLEFVCMDSSSPTDAAKKIKTFIIYLQGAEFSLYSEYHKRGFRCRYVGYDSKAFYRESDEVVVFSIKVKINNPLSYAILSSYNAVWIDSTPPTAPAAWWGLAINSVSGDIYASIDHGIMYIQESGVGKWKEQSMLVGDNRFAGLAVNSTTGAVYACNMAFGIYKRLLGSNTWVAQNATEIAKNWWRIAVDSVNSNVYACVNGGDIYKQTGGVGVWVALNATGADKTWSGIAANTTTKDVYACVDIPTGQSSTGDIYKQTAGSGNFVALSATGASKNWWGVTINSATNDVYACTSNGEIYKQTAGTGDWVIANTDSGMTDLTNIAVKSNGDVYACGGGAIYKQSLGAGLWNTLTIATSRLSSIHQILFTCNSPTDVYVDDGRVSNMEAALDSVSITFSEADHFAIVVPQKL